MNKKRLLIAVTVVVIILGFTLLTLFLKNKTMTYYWYEQQVIEPSNLPYMSQTLKQYTKLLKTVEQSSAYIGAPVELMWLTIYGSAITKNNPKPNDIDCESSFYLGEYDYNGKNDLKIAASIFNKISNFYYLIFYFADDLDGIYTNKTVSMYLNNKKYYSNIVVENMAKNLKSAISGKPYLLHTKN